MERRKQEGYSEELPLRVRRRCHAIEGIGRAAAAMMLSA
jgi:hypothetical protein